jgi:hypothetical protein
MSPFSFAHESRNDFIGESQATRIELDQLTPAFIALIAVGLDDLGPGGFA